jgi:putative ABC transport system permease protein
MSRMLSAAPWRRAPLLAARQPAVALAMAVTVALLGLAGASYPLYLASAGSGALAIQEAQLCPSALDSSVVGSGLLKDVPAATASLDALSKTEMKSAAANPGDLQAPIVTQDQTGIALRLATNPSGPMSYFQLASRTEGLQNLTVVSSAGGAGVWLSNDLAQSIGAKAGSYIVVGQDPDAEPVPPPGATTRVRVAGIYENLVGTVLPRFWCTQTAIFGTYDSSFPPPPVVLATPGTMDSVLGALGIRSLTSYQWERMLVPGLTVPETTKALGAMNRFSNKIGIQAPAFSNRQGWPIGGGLMGFAATGNQLAFVIAHSEAVEKTLTTGILPVSLAGLVVTALLVAAAGSYWVDRRRLEVSLLSSKGAGPTELGLKAALESIGPVALGAIAGWGAAYGLVAGIGPSSVLPLSSLFEALWIGIGIGLVSFLLVWAVASIRVRGTSSTPSPGRRRYARIPFEIVPLGISIWAWSTLGQQSLQVAGTTAPGVGASFLVFPILFVLSVSALGARITSMVLGSRWFKRRTASIGNSAWLASRRLAGVPRVAALCVVSVAAAVGVLVYGSALTTSQNATLNAKAAVFVGSTTSVQFASAVPVPASLASTTTAVQTSGNALLGGTDVDVIGVDPTTFARGAFWDRSFDSRSLQTLLDELSANQHPGGPLPVLIAGGPNLSGSLSLQVYGISTRALPTKVVGYPTDFPGENAQDPLVITTQSALREFGASTVEVFWSHEPDQRVLADLQRAGEQATILVTVGDVLDQTAFEAIAWTFAYLQALGILAGAVIVGGLLLFVSTRTRARALAYVLSRRMGLRRSTHLASLVIEIGVLIVPGTIIGGAIGWVAVELAQPHLNPLPLLSPPPLLEIPFAIVVGGSAAVVGIWGLISGWAQHVADRSRASELLRADD